MDDVAEHWRKTVNAQQEEITRLRKDLRKALEKNEQLEQTLRNHSAYGPTAGLTIERQGNEIKRLRTLLYGVVCADETAIEQAKRELA